MCGSLAQDVRPLRHYTFETGTGDVTLWSMTTAPTDSAWRPSLRLMAVALSSLCMSLQTLSR